jgi:hypothetical protein
VKHGDRVWVTGFMYKSETLTNIEGRQNRNWLREWIKDTDEGRAAVFLGIRMKYDGWLEHITGSRFLFNRTKSHRCALVSFDSRSNPVCVPIEYVQAHSELQEEI